MTNSIFNNEFSLFINQQISSIEDLDEHLARASALIEMALRHGFSEISEKTIHHYLWVLSDIIESACDCSKHSLSEIFAANRLVNTTINSPLPLVEASE